jgi:hypothetical protein
MKLRVGILVLACGLVFASTGLADAILVNNASFETLPSGGLPIPGYLGGSYSIAVIPGWVGSGYSGQFQPGGPSGTVPNGYYNTLSDGPTEAYIATDEVISQTVGATVQAGVTYTLLVDIGARLDQNFLGAADLLINGHQYVATGVKNLGGFATYRANYTGLAGDAGDPITIQLSSTGQQGDFDNVRLSCTGSCGSGSTVPEPSEIVLLGPVLIGIGVRQYRRRSTSLG